MILVVGGTGSLGGAVARALLEQGETVRILVRVGSQYGDLVEAGAEAVTGDLKDPDSLRAACAGVDVVVTTATSAARGGDDTTESVDLRGNQNLIDAARAGRVERFVLTSALGASAEHPIPFLQAKGQAEVRLRNSGMSWTILQPNLYMDTWIPMIVAGPALAGRPVTLVGEGRRLHSFLAMRDVVSYIQAALSNHAALNETLVIGGPAPLSWWDVVAAFERELARAVPVNTLPLGALVPGLPETVNGLFQALEMYDSPIEMETLAATFGVTPTPVATFVTDFLAAHRSTTNAAGT